MHEVLVNRLGGLSLPRKSVVRLTDRPDMTIDVYRGRKTTKNNYLLSGSPFLCKVINILVINCFLTLNSIYSDSVHRREYEEKNSVLTNSHSDFGEHCIFVAFSVDVCNYGLYCVSSFMPCRQAL